MYTYISFALCLNIPFAMCQNSVIYYPLSFIICFKGRHDSIKVANVGNYDIIPGALYLKSGHPAHILHMTETQDPSKKYVIVVT